LVIETQTSIDIQVNLKTCQVNQLTNANSIERVEQDSQSNSDWVFKTGPKENRYQVGNDEVDSIFYGFKRYDKQIKLVAAGD